ncbi:phage Gp37/Gp68 family protein [Acidobacteria bacterium AH-259-L09]|nr:phage Gp37/Gp68 family protein [Acidobacteria bacterium AH-259-L09]
MAYQSKIEWTETTWNPVTGCNKVSTGCKYCYAERISERFRGVEGHPYEQGFDLKIHRDRLESPSRWRNPRRIFVNSMSDLFHEQIPFDFINDVFDVMEENPKHTFQVLTKRPDIMLQFFKNHRTDVPPNVWLGISVETQEYMWRLSVLKKVPANVRFVSCEPLLGPLVLDLDRIHWVIVGGESGPKSRPIAIEWVRDIRAACLRVEVPFFFKQWGGSNKAKSGRILDGRTWDEFPCSAT